MHDRCAFAVLTQIFLHQRNCQQKRVRVIYFLYCILCVPLLQLRLRPPSVAFGQVVVGSWVSRDVLLSNIGELPMTFRFSNLDAYLGLITISPSQGTLQPQADLPVTVTFRPTKVISQALHKARAVDRKNSIGQLPDPFAQAVTR